MKKLCNLSVSRSILSTVLVFVFALAPLGVFGASTIGTNMSTTGTFLVNPAANSATSIRFQNAAGTNYFVADSTNSRIGVGEAPSTTFEVQGTASASYFFTGNTIQVGGGIVASVAYNRFGSTATTNSLSAVNDVLVNGKLEVDGIAFFDGRVGLGGAPSTKFEVQGTASASYFLTTNTIQAGALFSTATVAYSRFGAGTTGYSAFVSAADDLLVTGSVEGDGPAFFDGTASVAGKFEAMGVASSSQSFVSRNLIVGSNVASSSSIYTAEFGGFNTATVSILFGGDSSSKGTCLQMKNTAGAWTYVRIVGTTWTVDAKKCSGV